MLSSLREVGCTAGCIVYVLSTHCLHIASAVYLARGGMYSWLSYAYGWLQPYRLALGLL